MNRVSAIIAVLAGGLTLGLAIGQDALAATNKLSGNDLIKELQSGGYVIYIRHAQTKSAPRWVIALPNAR